MTSLDTPEGWAITLCRAPHRARILGLGLSAAAAIALGQTTIYIHRGESERN